MVISLTEQLKNSQGDFARTIESPANQLRILSEQTERFSRALGNVLMPILSAILPYLNAFLMVLTEVTNALARLIGFELPEFDYSSLTGASDSLLDLEDAMNGTSESAEKLRSGLRGFDKLNVITTPTSSGTGSGLGSGIDPRILEEFYRVSSEYNDLMDNVKTKASIIAEGILEWLGFEKDINGEWEFRKLTLGSVLGILGAGGLLVSGISKITSLLKKLGIIRFDNFNDFLKNSMKAETVWGKIKNTVMGSILVFGGTSIIKDSMTSIIEEGENLLNVLGLIGGSLSTVFGGAMIGSVFGQWGTAIGAVTGGIISLYTTLTSYEEGDISTGNIKARTSAMEEYTNSLKRQYEEVQKNAEQEMALTTVHENYIKELEAITNTNGKVKDGYETRANFIINELNSAYGTEIKMVDGVIQKYDEQIGSIKEIIQQQKAKIYQQLAEEQYTIALKERYDTESNLIEAEGTLKSIRQSLEIFENKLADITEERNELLSRQNELTLEERERLRELNSQYEKTTNKIDSYKEKEKEAIKQVDIATSAYEANQRAIANYSGITTAIIEGDAKAIDKFSKQIEASYSSNVNNKERSIALEIELAKKEYDEQLQIAKNGGLKITEQIDANAKSRLNIAKNTLLDMSQTTEDLTPEVAEAWKKLAQASEYDFMEAFKQLLPNMQQQVVNKMYDQGYRFSSELQRGINAIAPTVKIKADTTAVNNLFSNLELAFSKVGLNVSLPRYENSGLPPVGQVFVANENGPEVVSQLGGQSVVANMEQMMRYLDRRIDTKLGNRNNSKQPAVFNFQIGNRDYARYMLEDLNEIARNNGTELIIGG